MALRSEATEADNLVKDQMEPTLATRKQHSTSSDFTDTHSTISQNLSSSDELVEPGVGSSSRPTSIQSGNELYRENSWSSTGSLFSSLPSDSPTEYVQLERKTHYSSSSSTHNPKAKRATKPLNNGRNYLCSLCRGPHYTHLCRKPLPFSYRASILLVKRQLCPKCVRKHHLSACNDTVPCEYCGSSDHATVLCQHLSV